MGKKKVSEASDKKEALVIVSQWRGRKSGLEMLELGRQKGKVIRTLEWKGEEACSGRMVGFFELVG